MVSLEQDTHEPFGVVGLGNYGSPYAGTRHNIGFEIIDALAERLHFRDSSFFTNYYFTSGMHGDKQLFLCKPWTYMNLSGDAVSLLMHTHAFGIQNLLVICDDTNLPPGRLRFRARGSSGGHNGLQSVIDAIGNGFPRLRCGIGLPPAEIGHADFVLSDFFADEWDMKNEMIHTAVDSILFYLDEGISKSMTLYNAPIANGADPENDNPVTDIDNQQ